MADPLTKKSFSNVLNIAVLSPGANLDYPKNLGLEMFKKICGSSLKDKRLGFDRTSRIVFGNVVLVKIGCMHYESDTVLKKRCPLSAGITQLMFETPKSDVETQKKVLVKVLGGGLDVSNIDSWKPYKEFLNSANIVLFNNPDVGYGMGRHRDAENKYLVESISDFANATLPPKCILYVSKSPGWAQANEMLRKELYTHLGPFLNHPLGVFYETELTVGAGGRHFSASLEKSVMYAYEISGEDKQIWAKKSQRPSYKDAWDTF